MPVLIQTEDAAAITVSETVEEDLSARWEDVKKSCSFKSLSHHA
jgi:hypothetical protein